MVRTLIVPQADLERMLAQWEPTARMYRPTYRFAKCWGCGRTLFFGMWHVFFERGHREAHLCGRCGRPYEFHIDPRKMHIESDW